MAAQAQAKAADPGLDEANFYELRHRNQQITFTNRNFGGQPQLVYKDGERLETFTGDQIFQEETALGRLLTVQKIAVDVITERFTLVLPKVLLAEGKAEKVETFVVFQSGHRIPRIPRPGPEETFVVKPFRGRASLVFN
jgi:hypothetical protein